MSKGFKSALDYNLSFNSINYLDVEMDTKILVAFIAAGASFLVAIVSVISAVISSRVSSKSAKELELLKHSLESERQHRKNIIRKDNEYLESLNNAVIAIQKVKDRVQIILHSKDNLMEIKKFSNIAHELVECYEHSFVPLGAYGDEYEKELFHSAKGSTLSLEKYLFHILETNNGVFELSLSEISAIKTFHNDLTATQLKLQGSLNNILINRV